jgi:Holliday junction resolvase
VTNRNKAKGTSWETEIVNTLQAAGCNSARRVVQAGAADVGDVHVGAILCPLVAIEAKNEKALTFSSYVDEANREADNAGALFGGVAWVKRRGKASALDGYVVMDGRTFLDWLRVVSAQVERGGAAA